MPCFLEDARVSMKNFVFVEDRGGVATNLLVEREGRVLIDLPLR